MVGFCMIYELGLIIYPVYLGSHTKNPAARRPRKSFGETKKFLRRVSGIVMIT
jgi:hypothetical protein